MRVRHVISLKTTSVLRISSVPIVSTMMSLMKTSLLNYRPAHFLESERDSFHMRIILSLTQQGKHLFGDHVHISLYLLEVRVVSPATQVIGILFKKEYHHHTTRGEAHPTVRRLLQLPYSLNQNHARVSQVGLITDQQYGALTYTA
jgi:hypothetical protein